MSGPSQSRAKEDTLWKCGAKGSADGLRIVVEKVVPSLLPKATTNVGLPVSLETVSPSLPGQTKKNTNESTFRERINDLSSMFEFQVIQMQNEISEKTKLIETYKQDHTKLRKELTEKEIELKNLASSNEKLENMWKDAFQNLKDVDSTDLALMQNVSRILVQDVQDKIKRSRCMEKQDRDESTPKQISISENYLDLWTKVHTVMLQDNANFRSEVHKLKETQTAILKKLEVGEKDVKSVKTDIHRNDDYYRAEIKRIEKKLKSQCGPTTTLQKPSKFHVSNFIKIAGRSIRRGRGNVHKRGITRHPSSPLPNMQ